MSRGRVGCRMVQVRVVWVDINPIKVWFRKKFERFLYTRTDEITIQSLEELWKEDTDAIEKAIEEKELHPRPPEET